MSEATELVARYSEIRKNFFKQPAQVIHLPPPPEPIPVPVPVQAVPPQEPVKPYVVPRDYPMLVDIFEETRKFYGVTKTDFISERRLQDLVFARQVAMYLCREMTLKSLPEIGRALGDRDHTTILHGARKIQGLAASDERLRDEIQLITIRVNERVAARNAVTR